MCGQLPHGRLAVHTPSKLRLFLRQQAGRNLTFGKLHCIFLWGSLNILSLHIGMAAWYLQEVSELSLEWFMQADSRFLLQFPRSFTASFPFLFCNHCWQFVWLCVCVCVLVVLLLEHNCTLPLLSLHSSHPTLCAGRGWSYRPCLATHSIITLFSSYHHSLSSYFTSRFPLFCVLVHNTLQNLAAMFMSSYELCAFASNVWSFCNFTAKSFFQSIYAVFPPINVPQRNFSPPCWKQKTHHWKQMKAG